MSIDSLTHQKGWEPWCVGMSIWTAWRAWALGMRAWLASGGGAARRLWWAWDACQRRDAAADTQGLNRHRRMVWSRGSRHATWRCAFSCPHVPTGAGIDICPCPRMGRT